MVSTNGRSSRLRLKPTRNLDIAVTEIALLEQGSYEKNLEVLEPRERYWYARQMVKKIQKQIQTSY